MIFFLPLPFTSFFPLNQMIVNFWNLICNGLKVFLSDENDRKGEEKKLERKKVNSWTKKINISFRWLLNENTHYDLFQKLCDEPALIQDISRYKQIFFLCVSVSARQEQWKTQSQNRSHEQSQVRSFTKISNEKRKRFSVNCDVRVCHCCYIIHGPVRACTQIHHYQKSQVSNSEWFFFFSSP